MKSHLPLFDLKGSIAILMLVTATTATALITGWQPTAAAEATATTRPANQMSLLASTWKYSAAKLPFTVAYDASVTTDRDDYSPGQVAYITGSGFQAGESVILQVTYADSGLKNDPADSFAQHSGHDPWTVLADGGGNISSSWLVEMDSFGRTLLLTADGQSSGYHAEHIFTDAVGKDFKQCSNNNGTAGLGRCVWINSIIQQSNSRYFEGMSTLQRLVLDAIPATTGDNHVLNFHDDFTKGGKHAYDFLTSWPQAVSAAIDAGVPYLDTVGGNINDTRTCGDAISATALAICNAVIGSGNFIDVTVPDDAYISHDGAVQPKINGYEAKYGNRTIRIYGNAPFISASFDPLVHDVANGADTADSIISYSLKWKSASTNVMILWGEHIALGSDGPQPNVGWGAGKGASSISGGPYHVSLDGVDGASLGSVDNQLKGADVLPPPPAGSITIVKDSIPDDAQSFNFTASGTPAPSPASFTLNDDPGTSDGVPHTQAFANLPAGTYNFAETLGVTDWTLTDIVCTSAGGSTSNKNVGAGTVAVTLASNDAVTCVFTNTKAAKLKLVKTVTNDNGGNAAANDWDLVATGSGGFTEANPSAGTATFRTVTIGVNYALSETGGPSGYTQGNFSCDGGTQGTNTIQLAAGDVVTCTVNNNDNGPTLALDKTVVNDNGGNAVENDFVLSATPTTGPVITDAGGDVPATAAFANRVYTLSETTLAGYSASAWVCTGTGVSQSGNTVTLSLGAAGVCAITNNDVAPTLALDKTVVNDNGGNAVENDFVLSATPTSGSVITDAGGDVPATAATANVAYTLSETTQAGYTASSWTCSGTGVHQSGATVTLDEGAVGVCGITNNDVAPTLALDKTVVNDNGGNAVENDFVLSATPTTGSVITDAGGDVPATAAVANRTYTLSETTLTGYAASAWSCSGTGVHQTGNTVTLDEGAVGVCGITNNDVGPTLALDKTVVNDNGGNAVENDFVLSATPSAGTTITDAGGDVPATSATANVVYTLSETNLTGYTASAWSCSGTGVHQTGNTVTLDEGAVGVCAITNNDVAPTLALDKTVVNDNGGLAVENDFVLSATPTTGSVITDAGGDVPATTAFANRVYTLSETTVPGYAGSAWSCSGTGVHQSSNTVTLDEGAVGVCAITNNDIAPQLKVVKLLDPTDDPGKFNLRIDGSVAGGATDVGHNGTTGFVPVNAGVHTVSETAGTGTSLDDYVTEIGGDCAANGTVTVAVGGPNKTCTITNHRKPRLTIVKMITGDSASFDFVIDGIASDPVDLTLTPPADGSDSDGPNNIAIGLHNVMEVNIPSNWLLNGVECTSTLAGLDTTATPPNVVFTARYGDNITCTFVNNQQGGTTRTQGFWATHTILTNTIWNGGTLPPGTTGQDVNWQPVVGSGDEFLCNGPVGDPPTGGTPLLATPLPGQNQVLGGFWASISQRTALPKKREALDQARMAMLQQYLAAVLNVHAFGTPLPGGITLADARETYCSNNIKMINSMKSLLAGYNEDGDNGVFTPGANATAQESRRQANIPFWDSTIH